MTTRHPTDRPRLRRSPLAGAATLIAASLLAACGGGDDGPTVEPEEARAQDARTFSYADSAATTFGAMAAAAGDTVDMAATSRWAGTLDGAAYRVEVPPNWNGRLVMYAHGFVGNVPNLAITNPPIRRWLIQNGYAWAASSYARNYYDVRAGVEDTNRLANEFTAIAARSGRTLAAPTRTYIIGHSMGGHIAGAAVEAETAQTARNKVAYAGAVPMCGVMGDAELFNQFAAMQVTAQALAGVPSYPFAKWSEIEPLVRAALFTTFPSVQTPAGLKYASVVKNITGGERPLFAQGLAFGGSFPAPWGVFGGDGTINGILNASVLDTRAYTYNIDGDAAGSAALNAAAMKMTPVPDANRLRRDGLRWIPQINGDIKVPVVTIHTLGDLFVPFSMQQVYARRVAAKGNGQWLVQRAIRGASHCDFTVAEQVDAFTAMVNWEQSGTRPAGDDVLTPATVAAPTYGCAWTRNTLGPDESGTVRQLRPAILGSTPACPS